MNETKSQSARITADMTVYVDLENARKAITAAAIELVRGDEYNARQILVDWLAEDRGERIPLKGEACPTKTN